VQTPEDPSAELEELVLAALLSEDPEEQREALSELTGRIDALPTRLKAVVQELSAAAQGEARLTYASKWSTGRVLSTPAVPLQEWSNLGGETAPDEWRNKLIFGDNLGVLAALLRMKQRGELKNADGTDGVRVCYIDPPFATEREFTNSGGVTAYKDKVAGAEFVEFLRRRLILIRELLADDGTLWVHLDTKKVHYVKVVLDEVFGESSFQSEVIWKRQSAKNDKGLRQPGRIHETILMYSKGSSQWVWNKQFTPFSEEYKARFSNDDGDGRGPYTDSDLGNPRPGGYQYVFEGVSPPANGWNCPEETMRRYHEAGELKFPSGRGKTLRRKSYLNTKQGVQLQDLWLEVDPVNSQAKDKSGYPTEKPQALLVRVVTASSNRGDLVLDCFSGSGSTLRAAEHLGRRWIGVDCGKLAIHTATRDLMRTKEPDGDSVKPFSVYHAGLYNPEELARKLDTAAWTAFVLDLFGASHRPSTRRGILFHGRIGRNTRVHVVDPKPGDLFTAQDGHVEVGLTYLQSLVDASKPGPRTKLAVVVPDTATKKSTGLRQTAYHLRAAGSTHATEVRVLKVPPAVTADFLALDQPGNETAVNALINAHGFNVAIPPDVELTKKLVKGKPLVTVKSFESNSVVRATKSNPNGSTPSDEREDLAMVLIDYEHEQDRFDFEEVMYGDDLAKKSWKLELRAEATTSPTALMFIDRFGNEERLVLQPADFGGKQ
jgi:DNA modification methylase